MDGYTYSSGIINEKLHGRNIVAIPLEVDDYMEIGYLTHKRVTPSTFATKFIEELKRFAIGWGYGKRHVLHISQNRRKRLY